MPPQVSGICTPKNVNAARNIEKAISEAPDKCPPEDMDMMCNHYDFYVYTHFLTSTSHSKSQVHLQLY